MPASHSEISPLQAYPSDDFTIVKKYHLGQGRRTMPGEIRSVAEEHHQTGEGSRCSGFTENNIKVVGNKEASVVLKTS